MGASNPTAAAAAAAASRTPTDAEALPFGLLPGERILWSGRPHPAAFARHVLHVNAVAFYFAVWIVFRFYDDRSQGLAVGAALRDALPLAVLAGLFLLMCRGLAIVWCRCSRYFVTNERCVLQIGMALTASLSLPWRRIAGVALALNGDGTGDIALAPKRPHGLRFVNLWPHVRPWRVSESEPMLRCVPDAKQVADEILAEMRASTR